MRNFANIIVLKGQHNSARGNALGLKTGGENIVREFMYFKEQMLFWTKKRFHFLDENNESQFRPKEVFSTEYHFHADDFRYTSFSQGDVLVVSPKTQPWARLYRPFRPCSHKSSIWGRPS